MNFKDLLHETSSALLANKVRTSLTMLGIIIGIGSVIAMLSIGQGAQNSIESSIQSIGSNLVIVRPGAQRGPGVTVSSGRGSAQTLKLADANAIAQKINLAQAVAPEITSRFQIVAKGNNTNTTVTGTVSAYESVRNIAVDEGTFITDQHNKSLSRVAVIGPTTRDDLFGEGAEAIGQTIGINKIDFKIVGITKAKGGSGFGSADDVVYIPLSVASQFLVGGDYVSAISVSAKSQDVMSEMQDEITTLLLEQHHIASLANADFSIMNQADIVATASSVTSVFTLLLASVAGISLVVGGIGIMNMMLTTVTERTKEIGLRKAVGARRKDINRQFLVESIMLTFVGGIIGVILGWLVSFVISSFGVIATSVSISSVVLAFFVSAVIGIAFGYYPARRAASLNPIEALRYE